MTASSHGVYGIEEYYNVNIVCLFMMINHHFDQQPYCKSCFVDIVESRYQHFRYYDIDVYPVPCQPRLAPRSTT